MPHDREAISSRTSGRRAAEEAGARRVGIWSVVGVGFTWIVVMAVWQKGFTGYLLAFMFLYVAFAVLGAVALARYAFRRYAAPMCAFGLLLAWWGIGGTYSWQRDALLGTVAFLAVLVAFPSSRIWLRRLPRRLRALWRLWRMRKRYEASERDGRGARRRRAGSKKPSSAAPELCGTGCAPAPIEAMPVLPRPARYPHAGRYGRH